MKQGRIYILPTRLGAIFLGGSLAMLLIGAAYQNNLVNLLAYFMMSLVFVAMVQTHNNIKDVEIMNVESEGGFAGGTFLLTTTLHNRSTDVRFNIEATARKLQVLTTYENVQALLKNGHLKLRSSYPAETRGRHALKGVTISSVYPVGLFRAWSTHEVNANYFVYPEAKGRLPFPASEGSVDGRTARSGRGDDYQGHRKYQSGDSQRHIDWKAHARGRPWMVKEFKDGSPQPTILDWHALDPALDTEARLSQLAAWIDQGRRLRKIFGLRLPNAFVQPSQGLEHSIRCLELLAAFDTKAAATPSQSKTRVS